ncbi:MAG: dynamin family protein [Verrucomicrobiales bacterium]|nr:dynamin family protein [Verrucomicrobiales bacterium]
MNGLDSNGLKNVVTSFLLLLDETEQLIRRSGKGREELADFLCSYRKIRVNPLYHRLKPLGSDRYVLSMVGLTNVGKSTLAHALLGHPVAPRRNRPATAVPVEYVCGPTWIMNSYIRSSRSIQTQTFADSVLLGAALERQVLDGSNERNADIERVIVEGPMELLDGGIIFADTPGFGAAQLDGQESHQDRLVNYIRDNVDEVFFCVSGANSTLRTEEVEFFREIQDICSTVVVTKWDSELDERDRDISEYKSRYSHLFPMCSLMFVEAKWAIAAQADNDPEKRAASRVEELSAFIRDRVSSELRLEMFHTHVIDAWNDLNELSRDLIRKAQLNSIPWREDSLIRFRRVVSESNIQLID